VAIVVAGLIMDFRTKDLLCAGARRHLIFVVETVAMMFETTIFAYLGMFIIISDYKWEAWLIFLGIVSAILSRAIQLVPLAMVINRFWGKEIDLEEDSPTSTNSFNGSKAFTIEQEEDEEEGQNGEEEDDEEEVSLSSPHPLNQPVSDGGGVIEGRYHRIGAPNRSTKHSYSLIMGNDPNNEQGLEWADEDDMETLQIGRPSSEGGGGGWLERLMGGFYEVLMCEEIKKGCEKTCDKLENKKVLISPKMMFILWYAGLRGGVSFALAENIGEVFLIRFESSFMYFYLLG